ncbi:uncharacterized protein BO97DRAFT_208264 [Aspergillus homomorphus CBS 101889]|uniref:Extracellular membrane protein CFEM domain-containing protein n=1 Tax=Aspergillus homomorphus (strain CBS 101889) TaxID=1450537 RepID=A0A395I6E8_ASPHC|nr:hypothetical protein BO97DRAFT_208264 [Aspergillus homomorphus CBS 101889]RAL15329.1 hypothetical protein BO97DRAFT_208264 [Aspergillus homomorphus CBS 101889]
MLLSLFQGLLLAALSVISCLASASQLYPTATTPSLASLLPRCARQCVDEFINNDYRDDACPQAWSLDCLCRTNTTSGYTLGEAAFRCSLSLCSVNTIFSSDLYDICDSVSGALPRTHATITATIMSVHSATTVVTTSSGSHGVTSRVSSTSRPSLTEHTITEHTTSVVVTSFDSPTTISDPSHQTSSTWATFSSTSTTSHNSTAAAAAATTATHSKLSAGAVIGISVASGMTGFFLIGALMLFYYRKNKHRDTETKDRNFFEIGGVMSEPPDFAFPPRRPTGPRPMPGGTDRDSETSRLITPFEPRRYNPTFVVDAPRDRYNNDSMELHSAHNIGFAVSSNSDMEASVAHSTPRTLSSLLPDKPTYGLYPEPLRWSRQKRPGSVGTLFEEDVTKPRSFLGSPRMNQDPSNWSRKPQSSRPHHRPPMAGLPAHPRAMLHGFRDGQDGKLALRGPNRYQRSRTGSPAEAAPHPTDVLGSSSHRSPRLSHENYTDEYWPVCDAGQTRPATASPYLDDSPEGGRRLVYGGDPASHHTFSDGLQSSRCESRHSGSLRPLTPVREIRTPTLEVPNWQYETSAGSRIPVGLPRMPLSRSVSPAQEIVSRPRIVRQDDIRRVQIRRVTPEPYEEPTGPFAPSGAWHGDDGYGSRYGVQARRSSFDSVSSAASLKGKHIPRKPVPIERNLTPSRRGSDLILQVD